MPSSHVSKLKLEREMLATGLTLLSNEKTKKAVLWAHTVFANYTMTTYFGFWSSLLLAHLFYASIKH